MSMVFLGAAGASIMEMEMSIAMPISLTESHALMNSLLHTPISYCRIHSKHFNVCPRVFCRLKNSAGIPSELKDVIAPRSRMVTRCSFNGVQLEAPHRTVNATSEISKESTGVYLQAKQSSNRSGQRLDNNGRFRSPRAARELALLILYAACVEGSNPLAVFGRRLKMESALQAQFDRTSLQDYDHMCFSGDPLFVETEDQARVLQKEHEEESSKEATILAAPLKLVYSNFVLSMSKRILEAIVQRWDQQANILNQLIPSKWKESNGRILEVCLLHLAMAEITVLGTRHQIVINETIDLAKRFCDGSAPRIINGCLRNFIEKEHFKERQYSQKIMQS